MSGRATGIVGAMPAARVVPLPPAPGRDWRATLPAVVRHGVISAGLALAAGAQAPPNPPPGENGPEAPLAMSAFVVNAEVFQLEDPVAPSNVSVTADDLAAQPQAGHDVFRALATMPGVTGDDLSAAFWVRGAPNHQVLARLDGIDLIEPYHLKDIDGAVSIIDLNSISHLDLSTGGFTAEHGQRLAGVLTMETPSGEQLREQTALDASLLSLRGATSGSVAGGRARWLASFRQGYPELALRLQGRADELSPEYSDASAKVEYQLSPRQVVSLHALRSSDTLEARVAGQLPLSSRYGSDYLWARWRGGIGDRWSGEAVAFAQDHAWRRNADGLFAVRRGLHLRDERRFRNVGVRNDWSVTLGERALVRSGWEARAAWADYRYSLWRDRPLVGQPGARQPDSAPVNRRREPWGASFSGYVAPRWEVRRGLVLEPSVRFDQISHTGDSDWSPRLNVVHRRGASTWRAAWGLYNQPHGLHELAVSDGEHTFHRSEQAEHRVLGYERRLRDGLNLRVEAYERRSWQLRPYWENPLHPKGLFPELLSDRMRFDPSIGRARGVEARIAGRLGARLRWSAAYALAKAGEMVEGQWVPSARDQRHTVQAQVSFRPNERWRFSAAWQAHAGWPVTSVAYAAAPRGGGTDWVRTLGPVYGERLPPYHRLDLRAARSFRASWGEVQVFLDVFNAYDRQNVLGYDPSVRVLGSQTVVSLDPVKLFPLLPNFGVSCRF